MSETNLDKLKSMIDGVAKANSRSAREIILSRQTYNKYIKEFKDDYFKNIKINVSNDANANDDNIYVI